MATATARLRRSTGPGTETHQDVVQAEDLRPVGRLGARRLVVHGGDGRLQLVGARAALGQRPADQRDALLDRGRSQRARSCSSSGTSSPCGPVRAARRASVSSISASRPATSPSSGSSRWTVRVSRIASRGQFGAVQGGAGRRRIALVEDQVEDLAARRAAGRGPQRSGRPKRHAPHLLLGPADALRHRRLGHQVRAGDLRRGQTADRAQGERDLRGRGQVRVAAQEEQGEGVVLARAHGPRPAAGP